MKIKLTTTQNDKLKKAFQHESSTREQVLTAQRIYNDAVKSRNDIFEMITDAHNINVKDFDLNATKFENGELVFSAKKVEKKSDTIRKALKKVKK